MNSRPASVTGQRRRRSPFRTARLLAPSPAITAPHSGHFRPAPATRRTPAALVASVAFIVPGTQIPIRSNRHFRQMG